MPEPRRHRTRAPLRVLLLVAPVLAVMCTPLAAQTFDRFFTTASERLLLDQARQEFKDPAPLPKAAVAAPVTADQPSGPVVPHITLSGVVIRGRGQDTSWINGSGIRPDEATPEGIRVQPERGPQARVQILLPESGSPISLLPGQKIDLATGAVLEAYQHDATSDNRSVFEGLGAKPSASGARDGGASDTTPPAPSGG